jgi:hypothetical protein
VPSPPSSARHRVPLGDLPALQDRWTRARPEEDYGQAVVYKGHDPACRRSSSSFDSGTTLIERGKVVPVSGNTYRMLHDTRFAEHFHFIGSFDVHHGVFEATGARAPFASSPLPLPKISSPSPEPSKSSGGCCG